MNGDVIARYYKSYGVEIVRGFMQYVWDSRGKQYIDANTNHGVAFLGHSNPDVVDAVVEQVRRIVSVPLNFGNEARDAFARSISTILPPGFGKVYLQNTGTEAVETAIKIGKKVTGRKTIVAFTNSFHGRTMGSLSITWNEAYRRAFQPLYPHVRFAPFNAPHAVDKHVDEDVCCVIVEPVQGEGGLSVATREFLGALRSATKERGALLIFDEIQCGFGRTGSVWAFEKYGVYPDLFTAGKAIGGGVPIGLVIASDALGEVFQPGEHGSTFAGNALAMAAAAAAIRHFVERDVPTVVRAAGKALMDALSSVKGRTALRVKGDGLMVGLELRVKAEPFVERLLERGVMALTASVNVLRFLPPYMISEDDIDHIRRALLEVLQ